VHARGAGGQQQIDHRVQPHRWVQPFALLGQGLDELRIDRPTKLNNVHNALRLIWVINRLICLAARALGKANR